MAGRKASKAMLKAQEPDVGEWDGLQFIVIAGNSDAEVLGASRLYRQIGTYVTMNLTRKTWISSVVAVKTSTVAGVARLIEADYQVKTKIFTDITEAEAAAAKVCGFDEGEQRP